MVVGLECVKHEEGEGERESEREVKEGLVRVSFNSQVCLPVRF